MSNYFRVINPEIEEYNAIGKDIIGAAFTVHQKTGRSLREKYYEAALCHELTKKGYEVQRQYTVPAQYDGEIIDDSYQADIVVNGKVIIEVKAVSKMTEAESRQLVTYLKLSDFKLGYLINFGARDFSIGNSKDPMPYQKGIYRFVNRLGNTELKT